MYSAIFAALPSMSPTRLLICARARRRGAIVIPSWLQAASQPVVGKRAQVRVRGIVRAQDPSPRQRGRRPGPVAPGEDHGLAGRGELGVEAAAVDLALKPHERGIGLT